MAAIKSASSGLVLPRPVTFVTGNAKKLEEVRAILGQSIPFQSLKLDCNNTLSLQSFFSPYMFIFWVAYLYSFTLDSVIFSACLIFVCGYFVVPELQGEPEDISKEKARLAAIQVL